MLMSAAEYRESLRRLKPRVFVNGERIESVADSPLLAPGIAETAARTIAGSANDTDDVILREFSPYRKFKGQEALK